MSDKERIEKFMLTLMHINKQLYLLLKVVDPEVIPCIQKMIDTNNYVLDKNADQINLDL